MRAEDRQRLIALAGRHVTRVTGVAGVTPPSTRPEVGSAAGVTAQPSVTPHLEAATTAAAKGNASAVTPVTPVTPVTRVTAYGEVSHLVRPVGQPTSHPPSREGLDHLLRELPEDWCAGLARLPQMEPPTGFTDARWAVGVVSAILLAHQYGKVALGLGWTTEALFGLHPVAPAARYDAIGLAFLLHPGDRIVSLTSQHTTIRCRSGAVQRAARGVHRAESIPAWSFYANRP